MIEEEAKKAPAKKPEVKSDSYEVIEPDGIEHDEKDKFIHGAKHNADFRKKYGDKWRTIANALAHTHTHFMRTRRDR